MRKIDLPISEECYLDTEIDISFHQMPKKKAKQNFDSDGEELDEYDSQELNQNMKSTVDSMKIRG